MSVVEKDKIQTVYNRLLPLSITIPAAWGTLAFFSSLFWRKTYLIHSLGKLRSHLQKSINLKNSKNALNNQELVYTHGKIEQFNNLPVKDPMFGISTPSHSLGLYRKYEIYAKLQHKEYGWTNMNEMQGLIPSELGNFQSTVLTNCDIKVENHTLAQPLLVELAEQHSNQLQITPAEVDDRFEEIKNHFINFRKSQQKQEIVLDTTDKVLYEGHPFNYAMSNYKDIYYEDNYIYICNDSNNRNQNDIRISLHDIRGIADVTILAQKKNNTLDKYIIPELINRDYFVSVKNHEGKIVNKNIGIINFIQKGLMEHQDVIQKIFQQRGKKAVQWTLLYAFAVYILYQYLCEQIGPMIDFRNWNDECMQELAKKAITKQGDQIIVNDPQFSTMQVGFISTAAHLSCNALFAAGHFSSFLIGGPLVTYWFYVFTRKILLEQQIEGEIKNLIEYSKQFENSQPTGVEFNFFDKIEFVKN